MNARARVHALLPILDSPADAETRETEMDHRLDAYRTEVLNEAAGILRARAAQYPTRRIFAAGLRHGALALAKAAMGRGKSSREADATPDFFQPGRTYTEPGDVTDWRFRCDSITTHPDDGERTALGWRYFRGEWEPYAYGEDDFEIHQIADVIGSAEDGGRS